MTVGAHPVDQALHWAELASLAGEDAAVVSDGNGVVERVLEVLRLLLRRTLAEVGGLDVAVWHALGLKVDEGRE